MKTRVIAQFNLLAPQWQDGGGNWRWFKKQPMDVTSCHSYRASELALANKFAGLPEDNPPLDLTKSL